MGDVLKPVFESWKKASDPTETTGKGERLDRKGRVSGKRGRKLAVQQEETVPTSDDSNLVSLAERRAKEAATLPPLTLIRTDHFESMPDDLSFASDLLRGWQSEIPLDISERLRFILSATRGYTRRSYATAALDLQDLGPEVLEEMIRGSNDNDIKTHPGYWAAVYNIYVGKKTKR